MLFYIFLILLFVAVFVFLGWRILTTRQPAEPPMDQFVCPHCNELHCDCHKRKGET